MQPTCLSVLVQNAETQIAFDVASSGGNVYLKGLQQTDRVGWPLPPGYERVNGTQYVKHFES